MEAVQQLGPQVVLLETDLADQPDVDAVRSFKHACPDVSVIVISTGDRGDELPETFALEGGEANGGDDVVSAVVQVFSGESVNQPDVFEDLAPHRVGRRITRGDASYASRPRSPRKTRLKRYNVLISGQRVCPRCYENDVVKWGIGDDNPCYECSGCGVRFVGAAMVGMHIGIAERRRSRE